MSDDKVVYEFQKNNQEFVKAVVKNWNGRDLFDLRVYFTDERTGAIRPGPKGLCLRIEHLPELQKAIQALEKEIATGISK